MLPQERLAYKLIYERYTLGTMPWFLTKDFEMAMDECGLRYRTGKGYIDLLEAINRRTVSYHNGDKYPRDNTMSEWLERGAERIDKVVTIDWYKRYGKYVGGILIT